MNSFLLKSGVVLPNSEHIRNNEDNANPCDSNTNSPNSETLLNLSPPSNLILESYFKNSDVPGNTESLLESNTANSNQCLDNTVRDQSMASNASATNGKPSHSTPSISDPSFQLKDPTPPLYSTFQFRSPDGIIPR